jgi:NitT/TauT family transport system substrate-binding protein
MNAIRTQRVLRSRVSQLGVLQLGVLLAAAGAALCLVAGASSAPRRAALTTINLDTLPIANGFPLDLGIKKGFFAQQGLEIKKTVLASGNDIVIAMANNQADIGYVGWVPAMIGRTQGIDFTAVAASDVEGTSAADNWQNIMVKGDSPIRTPADLAGKTIAVNALKGVGEVMIKAALQKSGVDPNSVKLLAVSFPTMRTALANGQVDAFWAPEPFVTQALTLDGARVVMAPGPILSRYWPVGMYGARASWIAAHPDLAKAFRTAMNQSLTYAQGHPDEIRAMLPAGQENIRLPIWSPVIDRAKLAELARYAKQYGVITTLPNLALLVPSAVAGGKVLQATVSGSKFLSLRLDGKVVTTLPAGSYTFVVSDTSKTQNFHFKGPGVARKTGVPGTGRTTWTLKLAKGSYTYVSDTRGSKARRLTVT